jgi:adenylate kinase family enzyme
LTREGDTVGGPLGRVARRRYPLRAAIEAESAVIHALKCLLSSRRLPAADTDPDEANLGVKAVGCFIAREGSCDVDIESLRRTVIVGTSCAGKTTFAQGLAGTLGFRHIELDALHWLPDWVARPDEEFRRLVAAEVSGESWVADGNYRKVRDIVWPRATAIVWLDYPFRLVAYRALSRTLRRVMQRQVLYSGNRETLGKSFFSRDSILLWVLQTHRANRREYSALSTEGACRHARIIALSSPSRAREFLNHVGQSSGAGDRP